MSDSKLARKILSLKDDITKAEKQINVLTGEEKQIKQSLKSKYKISSLEDAEKLLETKKTNIEKMKTDRQSLIEEIENEYDF